MTNSLFQNTTIMLDCFKSYNEIVGYIKEQEEPYVLAYSDYAVHRFSNAGINATEYNLSHDYDLSSSKTIVIMLDTKKIGTLSDFYNFMSKLHGKKVIYISTTVGITKNKAVFEYIKQNLPEYFI